MRRPHRLADLVLPCVLLLVPGCGSPSPDSQPAESDTAVERPTIEIRATFEPTSGRHLFETSANRVRAGWTTLRFTNSSPVVHFVLLDHMPGDRTSDELMSEVSPIFQQAKDLVTAGRADEATALFAELPEWFDELVFRGGPGFLSPGRSSEATVFLEPGNYVLECYVRTADGVFHWNLGMYADLEVTTDTTDAGPPADPTLRVTISDSALTLDGDPVAGHHLVEVDFQERTPGLTGADVHVVQLDEDTDIDEIATWVDFSQPDGLISTPEDPAPAEFLGGTHEVPLGNTAYFAVTLERGEYLLIAEQPTEASVHHRFVVP